MKTTRRQWMAAAVGSAAAAAVPRAWALVHEHVLVDFRSPPSAQTAYDENEVFRIARPHLEEVYRLGCRRLQDCTPAYLGRTPKLLRRLADATGLDIRTNTGWYAARDHKYLPEMVRSETAAQIARRWMDEHRRGVDGMKPALVKIGVNRAPLHEIDRKIVEAAALCSRETGLTVASHTGGAGAAALEQLEVFTKAGAQASKFVWVHADSEKDHALHHRVARAGAWVEFDHVSEKGAAFHLECVRSMAAQGLLHRTLISQDAGYYRPGEPGGGAFRPYAYLFTGFVPQLEEGWAETLLVTNPLAAFGGRLG